MGDAAARRAVLLVARPGPLRTGLRAVLQAIPQIAEIDELDQASAILPHLADHHPALLVLTADPWPDVVPAVVQQIRAEALPVRCLVVATSVPGQQAAATAGADAVLLEGAPAAEVFATVKRLLG